MSAPVRWGVMLGAGVTALNLLFGFAGWHRVYEMSFAFLAAAIVMNIGAIVLCLRARASHDGWGGQMKNAFVLATIASVIIFAGSMVVTTVIFPDYFGEMAEGYREAYVNLGHSPEEVRDLVAATAATSPVRSAVDGVVGTMVTSVVMAAIAGVWLRKRG